MLRKYALLTLNKKSLRILILERLDASLKFSSTIAPLVTSMAKFSTLSQGNWSAMGTLIAFLVSG
jgi:hypothetical protein